ncbi:hypothetical protein FKW77_000946 [Venturia effusa]|uniref:Translation initiation factor IF-2, mitochondrial n=1 Tax=Venturia effusa TaxID=50376 RepID=A0A517L6K9_9PEZI|nr:hypothetical protein FKW77_000946 [Venturia effusa]
MRTQGSNAASSSARPPKVAHLWRMSSLKILGKTIRQNTKRRLCVARIDWGPHPRKTSAFFAPLAVDLTLQLPYLHDQLPRNGPTSIDDIVPNPLQVKSSFQIRRSNGTFGRPAAFGRPAPLDQLNQQPPLKDSVGTGTPAPPTPRSSASPLDSRALLGLDDVPPPTRQQHRPPRWQQGNRGSAPHNARHTASRSPRPERQALDNVQDERTLNGHLERLSRGTPMRNMPDTDYRQGSGQIKIRRIQYGSPPAAPGEQDLDPNVTSQWNIRKRKPQDQPVRVEAAASAPPQAQKAVDRPAQIRNDPFGDINQNKSVIQGYRPLTDRGTNIVCERCGERGHTALMCRKRNVNDRTALSIDRTPANMWEDSVTVAEQNLRALKAARASSAALAPGEKLPPRVEELDDVEIQKVGETRPDVAENAGSESARSTPPSSPAEQVPASQSLQPSSSPTDLKPSPKLVRWTAPENKGSTGYETLERKPYERLDRGIERQQQRDGEAPKRGAFGEDRPARRRGRDNEDDEEVKPRRGRSRRRDEDDDDDEIERAPRRGKDKQRRRDEWAKDEDADEEPSGKKKSFKVKIQEARDRKKARDRYKKRLSAQRLKPIHLPEFISVSNLAHQLGTRYENFVERMEEMGFSDIGHDHVLTAENAGLIAMEYGFEPVVETIVDGVDIVPEPLPEDMSQFPPRPPIVTIMGHVDHGKTTLLDYLRKSSIVATEHGGITQHIGAFSVEMGSGKVITFLDTPGHAAFLSMRERGANVTDIVILVVAADDSVMPQTLEAIKHARSANVPMIVALNKVDKPDANVQKVKEDLARHGVEVEEFGGDVQAIPVSGKTGQGMDMLEENIITLSEILDHRAPRDGNVEGWVLESATKRAGKVATVLVRRGTLRPGDIIVAGRTFARVRSLRNEAGVAVSEAGPGTPVEVDGWRGQPAAGDEVLQAPDEQKASRVIEHREAQHERISLATDMEAINESRKLEQQKREREEALEKMKTEGGELPEDAKAGPEEDTTTGARKMYFIIKGDVSGSIEAVINAISAIGSNEIQPHVLRSGVGGVTQFDIEHASAAKGHIIAFNTTVDPRLAVQAEKAGVKIIDQSIIYRLTEEVTTLLTDALPPLIVQRVVGEAEIAQEFRITIKGKKQLPVAGCRIRNGVVARTSKVKVLRRGAVVFDGLLSSLKNQKKDVTEMRKGAECGLSFEGWGEFEAGDQIQAYEEFEEKRKL